MLSWYFEKKRAQQTCFKYYTPSKSEQEHIVTVAIGKTAPETRFDFGTMFLRPSIRFVHLRNQISAGFSTSRTLPVAASQFEAITHPFTTRHRLTSTARNPHRISGRFSIVCIEASYARCDNIVVESRRRRPVKSHYYYYYYIKCGARSPVSIMFLLLWLLRTTPVCHYIMLYAARPF